MDAKFKALCAVETQLLKGETPHLPAASIEWLSKRFTREEIEQIVIPKRTLARRIAKKEPLTAGETDKVLRLGRIGAQAERVFGDPEKAKRWLRKPSAALSGQTPITLLKTEMGAQIISELLGQIAHGMFI
jgi:putative toxin-antitoxin system antitoxin component (TIGR02293 family)